MSDILGYLVENEPGFRKARLPALYSDFRSQQTLNPDGYQANVSAWRKAIAKLVQSGLAPSSNAASTNLLVLDSGEHLLRALESKQYGRPLALGTVVGEAIQAKDLVTLDQFLTAKESIYTKHWNLSPFALAGWALRQMGVAEMLRGADRVPKGQFVVVANVEDAAKQFETKNTRQASRFERTYSRAQFYQTFADGLMPGKTLSETDMNVLLKFLSRDKGLLLYDDKTVKVKSPGAAETALTEEDASIAQLRELIEHLTHQTDILNKRIDELSANAKAAVVKKNRVSALAALKSKKLAESTLEQRFRTLNQLEEVAAKIEQASDNVQLVKVMESSGEALKSLNAQVGGTERVDEVVDRLREQMDQADEVSAIIADSGPGMVIDESEIDDELAVLEGEEKRKEEEAERQKEAAEQARREAEQQKEAEEMQKRLDAIEQPKPLPAASTEQVQETAEGLKRLSLVEEPEPQAAS